MRVLIVDDEYLIRDVIREYCQMENYTVDEAENGEDAVKKVETKDYDIIIMDIMMPKLDGYQAIKKIKKIKDIPFIILSARNEEFDKLHGFDLGVDDYLTKPFSPRELISRIKAITKRLSKENKKYIFESLILDDIEHEVYLKDKKVTLTPKEYDLLKCFMQNNNVALSREQLLSNVWGYDFYGDDRTVDTHIKILRKSIKEYGKYIVTVRGMGYKFEFKDEKK